MRSGVKVAALAAAALAGARIAVRRRTRRAVRPDAGSHAARVARIASQLRGRPGTRPLSLRKRAVSHQVPKARDLRARDEKIDISDLDAILEIDPVARICVAEPGVTFVDLVAATLRH